MNAPACNGHGALTLRGIIAATFTPMTPGGEVAFDQIRPMVDFVLKQGADGLYVLGSTGEGPSLTSAERMRAAEFFVAAADRRVPVVVQVGHASIAESRVLAAHAAQCGATAVSATPPTYFKPETLDVLVASIAEIAAAAPTLPFYYYHIPVVTGVRFDMVELLERGAASISNLRGIKFSDPLVYEMAACIACQNGRFDIVFGCDEMLLSGLAAGARGAVGSTYNFAAPLYHDVMDAFEAGDLSRAAEEQRNAARMVNVILKSAGRGGLKAMMALIGCDCGPNRLPIVSATLAQRKKIQSGLDELGLLTRLKAPRAHSSTATAAAR